jgi:hypothetical protein
MFLSNGRVILRFFNPGASFFPQAGGLILKALNQAQKERQFEPPRAPSSPRTTKKKKSKMLKIQSLSSVFLVNLVVKKVLL